MAVRMLATDLDGTLLLPDGSVSQRTAEALSAADDAGLLVTLVTGRPPRWLAPIASQTGWHGLAVAANGAAAVDLSKRAVEHTFPIGRDELLRTISTIRELLPDALFGMEHVAPGAAVHEAPAGVKYPLPRSPEDGRTFGHEPGFRPGLAVPNESPTAPAEELIEEGNVIKLLARTQGRPGSDADLILEEIAGALTGVVTVTHSTTGSVLLEISRHGVTKATGLAWLARAHGIEQSEVVAVGDMPNDLPMLLWAGAGYAMGNAHPSLSAALGPDQTLAPNTEDGVAQLIESLIS